MNAKTTPQGVTIAREFTAIGASLILAIDQALIFAETLVGQGQAPAWLAVWGALGMFAGISASLWTVAGTRSQLGRW